MKALFVPSVVVLSLLLLVAIAPGPSRVSQAVAANAVYFPQVADTGGYTMTFVIINNQETSVTGTISFRRQDGAPMTVSTEIGSGGTLNINIPSRGTLRFTTTGNGGVGWAVLDTDKPVLASASYMLRQGASLIDQVGVLGTTPRTTFALYATSRSNEKIGLAIANPNQSSTAITLRLFQKSDGQLLASRTINLAPGNQLADFLDGAGLFGISNFEGYVDVSSTLSVVALGLSLSSGQLSSLALPSACDTGADNFYFPQVADAFGYTTSFFIVNNQDSIATGTLSLRKQDGTPMAVSTELGSGSILRISIPARGSLRFKTAGSGGVGWAVLATDKPVLASATFENQQGGVVLDQVGVLGTTPRNSFSLYAVNQGDEKIGLAIANPNSTPADITLRLYRKSDGALVATRAINLAGNTQKADFLDGPNYFGSSAFEGYVQVDSNTGVVALGLDLNGQQLSSLALPSNCAEGALAGKIVGKVVWALPNEQRSSLVRLKAQIESLGNTVAGDGSFVIFPDMIPGGWEVRMGGRTATIDTAGNFKLTVPSGVTTGEVFDHGLPQAVGSFSISQLSSADKTPTPILLHIDFKGPCGMSGLAPGKGCTPPASKGIGGVVRFNTYPPKDRDVLCEIGDGPLANDTIFAIAGYFGSTCWKRVQAGCCPNEGGYLFGKTINCWPNHKGRLCQELRPADILVNGTSGTTSMAVSLGQKIDITVHNNGCTGETVIDFLPHDIEGTLTGARLAGSLLKHYNPDRLAAYNPNLSVGSELTYETDQKITYEAPKCINEPLRRFDFIFFKTDGTTVELDYRLSNIGNYYKFRSTRRVFDASNGPRDGFHIAGADVCPGLHVHGNHPCSGSPDPDPNGCGQGIVDPITP